MYKELLTVTCISGKPEITEVGRVYQDELPIGTFSIKAPIGYRFTGEVYPPKKGQYYYEAGYNKGFAVKVVFTAGLGPRAILVPVKSRK